MNGWWNIIVLRDWYDDTVDALALSTCVGLTQVNEEKTWASWLSFIVTTSANDIDVEKKLLVQCASSPKFSSYLLRQR